MGQYWRRVEYRIGLLGTKQLFCFVCEVVKFPGPILNTNSAKGCVTTKLLNQHVSVWCTIISSYPETRTKAMRNQRNAEQKSFSIQVTKRNLATAGTDQDMLPSEDRLLLTEMGWTCSHLMSWWTDWCITKPKHLHCNWLPDRQPAQKTSQWVHTPSDKTISRWP